MMRNAAKSLVLLSLLAIVLFPVGAAAKGPVDLITIEGPGLSEPIQIKDHPTLGQFDPWAGQFLGAGEPLEAAPNVGEPFQVKFYLNGANGQPELHYVFYYYFNTEPGRGYIYLPGPEDEHYTTNIGTIIRGTDGRWHESSPAWDRVMNRLAGAQAPNATGSAVVRIGWPAAALFAIALLAAILALRMRSEPNIRARTAP